MDNLKATPQEIYDVLEQQKKLKELRAKLVGVLDKVNQSINSITVNFVYHKRSSGVNCTITFKVENIELTSSQIDNLCVKKEEVEQKPVIEYNIKQHEKRAEEINQQLIDLELKFSHYEVESDEEDELDL